MQHSVTLSPAALSLVDVFGLRRPFRLLQLAERAKTRDDGDEDDGDGRSGEGARSTKRKTATWRNDDQPSGRKTESNVSLSPTSRSEWDKFNLTRECSEFRLL